MAKPQKTLMDYETPDSEFPEDDAPLSFIQPRETLRVIKARDERRVIEKLRIGLPLAAAAVVAMLFIWPAIKKTDIKHAVMNNLPDLVIQNLHFSGTDDKNEPYSLMAAKATRPSGLTNIYDLDKPQAEITLANGAWLSGKAQAGRYDQTSQQLWLGGDVQLFHDKGYQFTTDEAQVSLSDYNAWGEKPVLIQGSFGEIRGHGFRMLDSGNVMVIKGPATASLSLHPAPASDKPAGTK